MRDHLLELYAVICFDWKCDNDSRLETAISQLVGSSQGLSASQQCFPLTTNQHQSGLSVQKPTSEQADDLFGLF